MRDRPGPSVRLAGGLLVFRWASPYHLEPLGSLDLSAVAVEFRTRGSMRQRLSQVDLQRAYLLRAYLSQAGLLARGRGSVGWLDLVRGL